MTDLETLKSALAKGPTPGPWFTREDHDYYQGGTYIGTGGYKYIHGPEVDERTGFKITKRVDTNEDPKYFDKDICRVEGGDANEEYLLAVSPDRIARLIERVEEYEAVLGWYSQAYLYDLEEKELGPNHLGDPVFIECSTADLDSGERARAVLAKYQEGK